MCFNTTIRILVTVAAGFIGAATAQALLDEGHDVVGIDDVHDYYETSLKDARIAKLGSSAKFRFERANLADRAAMKGIFVTVRSRAWHTLVPLTSCLLIS